MKKLGASVIAAVSLIASMLVTTPAQASTALDPSCVSVITQSNSVYQGNGNAEVICIDANNVTVNALGGNDRVIDYGVGNIINLGDGSDDYDGALADGATVDGGPGNDEITGTPLDDEINGGTGADIIYGGAGADDINGEVGADRLYGQAGADDIHGEDGADLVEGGDAADTLYGDDDNDSLIGGAGDDTMRGGQGNDTLDGSAGDDDVWGETGTDRLTDTEGDNIIAGGDGVDVLEGGWGLDLCDYDTTEVRTTTCLYDDSAPSVSGFNWLDAAGNNVNATGYDVTYTEVPAISKFTLSDQVASESVQVTCWGSNIQPVKFNIFWEYDRWLLISANGRSKLISAEEQGQKSRLQTQFTVETTITKGLAKGDYSCVAVPSDRLAHQSSSNVSPLKIARTDSTNPDTPDDDEGPVLEGFAWSATSYDVTQSAADLSFTIRASDATAVSRINVVCPSRYTYVLYETLGNVSGNWIGAPGVVTLTAGDASKSPTLRDDTHVRMGMKPGSYNCQVWMIDSLGHYSWANIATPLVITRSGANWDDLPPKVVSFDWDKASYEVGSANDLAVGTIHIADKTGTAAMQLTCYSPASKDPLNENNWVVQTSVSANFFRNTDGTWFANGMNNVKVLSTTGTSKDLVLEFQTDIAFGLLPGPQSCTLYAIDDLVQWDYTSIDKLTVFRIPPGMPGAPTNLRYEPTVGNPNTGILYWDEPEFLGTCVKNADGTDKMMPGVPGPRCAGSARDYEIEYSFDAETWTRIKDGYSWTSNLPMSNLYSAKRYFFRVRANNGGNDIPYSKGADWSEILEVVTPSPTVAAAPTDLVVSNITKDGATFRWTAPITNGGANITNFKVETLRSGSDTWQLVKKSKDRDVMSSSLNLVIHGMAPGTNYQIRISAQNKVGFSEFLTGELTTLDGPATAPQNLGATDITPTTMNLNWDLPLSNGGKPILDYQVEVSGNGGNVWTKISHEASNSNRFAVTNLVKGKAYKFRVAAITEMGVGSVSSVLNVTSGIMEPEAPTNLVASAITNSKANIVWKAPLDNGGSAITDYIVEVSSDDGETWNVIDSPVSTVKAFKLSGMSPGTAYRVRVAAANAAGYQNYVETSFTTLVTTASAPLNVRVTDITETTARIEWDLPASNGGSNIIDYKVEIAENCKNFQPVEHVESNLTNLNITSGMAAGTKYCFRVSAKTAGAGYGATSENVNDMTLGGLVPEAPIGLGVLPAKTSVTLSWGAAVVTSGSAVRNYKVEYSKDGGTTWLAVTKPVSTATRLIVTGLRYSTTYQFRVTATNDVGDSQASLPITVVTKSK